MRKPGNYRSVSKSRYAQVYDGQWMICEKHFDLACCHCQLVHNVSFRVRMLESKPVLEMRMNIDNRATAQLRRHKRRKKLNAST